MPRADYGALSRSCESRSNAYDDDAEQVDEVRDCQIRAVGRPRSREGGVQKRSSTCDTIVIGGQSGKITRRRLGGDGKVATASRIVMETSAGGMKMGDGDGEEEMGRRGERIRSMGRGMMA